MPGSGNASELERAHQAPFVDTFQQSRSHDPMHFDGGANSLTREPISLHEEREHRGLTIEHKQTMQTKRTNRSSFAVNFLAAPASSLSRNTRCKLASTTRKSSCEKALAARIPWFAVAHGCTRLHSFAAPLAVSCSDCASRDGAGNAQLV